jgi:hypothetical protein
MGRLREFFGTFVGDEKSLAVQRTEAVVAKEAIPTAVCCLLGNALLVPRALATRDHIFFTGTASCSLLYWGQLARFACCAPKALSPW